MFDAASLNLAEGEKYYIRGREKKWKGEVQVEYGRSDEKRCKKWNK
jgi:hypothetical protein